MNFKKTYILAVLSLGLASGEAVYAQERDLQDTQHSFSQNPIQIKSSASAPFSSSYSAAHPANMQRRTASSEFSTQVQQQNPANTQTPRARSYALRILQPVNLDPKSFAAELHSNLWSDPELSRQMEQEHQRQLENFAFRNGFYAGARSTRQSRPFLKSEEDEALARSSAANSLQRYMLLRGIPKFLSSREETREIGERYQYIIETAQNAATVEYSGTGDNPWKFSSGLNALNARTWIRLHNDEWNFEFFTHLDQAESLVLQSTRRFRQSQLQHNFWVQKMSSDTSFSFQINGALRGAYTISVPLTASNETLNLMRNSLEFHYRF